MGDGTGKRLNVPGREYNRNGLSFCPCTSWRWDPRERFFDDIVDAYEKAYRNPRVHSKGYPCSCRDALHNQVGQRAVLCHARVDPFAVAEVVGQGRVHIGKSEVVLGSDFIRAF